MAAISGASLNPIYQRLNGVAGYHPFEAETFADWSVEAGDIITVSRDGKNYQSPVHSTRLKWKGAPQMTVNSTGNEKRDAVAKVERRKYARGSGGRLNSQGLYSDVWSEDGIMHSLISQTADQITQYVEDTEAQLRSGIEITAREAKLYSDDINRKLHAELKLQADNFRLAVESETSAASIVGKINNGGSQIVISANHIALQGVSTIDKLFTGEAIIPNLRVQNLRIQAQADMGYIPVSACINSAVVRNNELKLYNMRGELVATFSKATTLSGAWGGTNTYTVTAKQNNVAVATHAVSVSTRLSGSSGQWFVEAYQSNAAGAPSISGAYTILNNYLQSKTVSSAGTVRPDSGYIGLSSVTVNTEGHSISIPTNQIYTTSGSPPSGATNASTLKTRTLQAISDGDTVCFRVDCGSASKWYYMSF